MNYAEKNIILNIYYMLMKHEGQLYHTPMHTSTKIN